ncbi:MAG: hypothetical protein A3F18_05325 [Legionellales bacterium RIFCSPHIGHO2_12_FULL_37_14]|nr:MAG: hypothetical protein A3F18_05325 [Legionellales bacterium RIFCSPHIGHO2_12_FULL_37_14]
MYKRLLNLKALLEKKSFFLFGPRSTGKTTLITEQLPEASVYDLLDAEIFRKLLRRPALLEEENKDLNKPIVIDEIQKMPSLLDEVQRLMLNQQRRFLLTGSSARKLKRGSANLLAGRAWNAELFPLTSQEIPQFDLLTYLNHGGLPQVYSSVDAMEELNSYVSTYLYEEIQAEAATRQISAFAEFLDLIALTNGQEISFEGLARDSQVSPSTIKNYLTILEDTLLGFTVPGYTRTQKRKAISRAKFYLFDIGVTNHLCRRSKIQEKSELFGLAFEHFIALELRAYISYRRLMKPLRYWRTTSQIEVDFIIGDEVAIEVKSSHLVQDKHLQGLRMLKEENIKPLIRYIVVSCDPKQRVTNDGIEIYPWADFLEMLWKDQLCG